MVAGGMCWSAMVLNGRCMELLSDKVSKEECCTSESAATAWSSEDLDTGTLFFWRSLGGGVPCYACKGGRQVTLFDPCRVSIRTRNTSFLLVQVHTLLKNLGILVHVQMWTSSHAVLSLWDQYPHQKHILSSCQSAHSSEESWYFGTSTNVDVKSRSLIPVGSVSAPETHPFILSKCTLF